MLCNCMHDAMIVADRSRVLLSGEFPDYIHAVSANVSNASDLIHVHTTRFYPMHRDISRRMLTS